MGQKKLRELTAQEFKEVEHRIEQTNGKRSILVAYTGILLELLLILFHDLPNLSRTNYDARITLTYLAAHVFLLVLCIAVVLAQGALSKGGDQSPVNYGKYAWVSSSFGMLFLSAVAFITGLDQLINNQIVSFITMFAVGSVLYFCKPPRQIYVLGIPVIIFTLSVLYFQNDSAIASANIINGLMFSMTMIVMSIFNYYKARSEISKEILLEVKTKKLDFLAHHDTLTGLYNRRRFDQEVLNILSNSHGNHCFALGIMDLDFFKGLNDNYGHDHADEVLIRVAAIMQVHIENDGIVARWGGEEFIFMLKGATFQSLVERTEAIRQAIAAEKITVGSEIISVTGSFGITQVLSHEYEDLKAKFRLVDEALYVSKDAGRNRVTVKLSK